VAAAERLVAAHGYTGTSVVAIAQEADVAAGSIYLHFASKAALFDEVFRRAAGRELAAVRHAAAKQSGAPERLTAIVETFAHRALQSGRLAWALLAEPVDPVLDAERLAFRHAYRDALVTVLADGAATGQFALDDLELTAAALVGAIAEALVGPLSPLSDRRLDEDQLVYQLIGISLQIAGARSRKPASADEDGRPNEHG